MFESLPVVIIGAGPVGLAAAAHLKLRGLPAVVLEAGSQVGSGVSAWSQVRMFSSWRYNIDKAARALLEASGWTAPPDDAFPTGGELVRDYLMPLADVLGQDIRLGAEVVATSRVGTDRLKERNRSQQPLVVRYRQDGVVHEIRARALIDASGTTRQPNPMAANGLPLAEEESNPDSVWHGIPDVLGSARARYAGRRVAVIGSGHSAQNLILDLARLARQAPGTTIQWVVRQPQLARVLGGGLADQLAERGRLGLNVRALVQEGRLDVATGFHVAALNRTAEGLELVDDARRLPPVDQIIVATGFRPRLDFLGELRLDLDPIVQAPRALAPMIDPNLHQCGSVRPHGARILAHPEPDVYLVGMKSYGRAPTFLLLTGHEQVRSVVAAIAGDHDAAERVELELPETGVCITDFGDEPTAATSCCTSENERPQIATGRTSERPPQVVPGASCCGGPSKEPGHCCVSDQQAKAKGQSGCGCNAPVRPKPRSTAVACCT